MHKQDHESESGMWALNGLWREKGGWDVALKIASGFLAGCPAGLAKTQSFFVD